MEKSLLRKVSDHEWHIRPHGAMRVPGVILATEKLIGEMDHKVYEQVVNVASLPGIVRGSYAMPDAHWGYGFPIGGVAAFDPAEGGVISAGGVGYDVSCGVRTLLTGLDASEIEPIRRELADLLFKRIPAGVGSTGRIRLSEPEMDAMLAGGASWAVGRGYGSPEDLARIEERGRMEGADPEQVSAQARKRQRDEMGTLGSGNHYLELQRVTSVVLPEVAAAFGIGVGDLLISIHCGSRGLGHQIATEFVRQMAIEASRHAIRLPDRELACAPINSDLGRSYLGAMRAAINCALANRQILTHLTREAFAEILPQANLRLLYDVSHNTCKVEDHVVDGTRRRLYIHRKGATRAFGPGHPDLPAEFRTIGQPVLIGGTMGTASYILVGTKDGEELSFSSSCHGAGRNMSRKQAIHQWKGREVVDYLDARGITVRSPSMRGVAEEAPGAYKDVSEVVEAADRAGISRIVARVEPMIVVKG